MAFQTEFIVTYNPLNEIIDLIFILLIRLNKKENEKFVENKRLLPSFFYNFKEHTLNTIRFPTSLFVF